MKKLSFSRSMAAAAMAVLTLGPASFVSCDKFDDTELRTSIDEINTSLDDLDSRVEALETAVNNLNTQVKAVTDLLSGNKIISGITRSEDGTQYTITYAAVNGVTPNPDVIYVGETNDNTGLVTTVTEGDVAYWAVYGEDGKAVAITTVNDEKIPVKHPDVVFPEQKVPTFRINDGDLEVSINDGTNWYKTGVKVSDIYTPEVPLIKEVVPGDGEVTFTLNGVNVLPFSVPMVTELSVDIVNGKTLFSAGETKTLTVNASGFAKYVLTAPFGWTATFNGTTISVTAPADDATAATSGEIVLQVFGNGFVEMDKVTVGVGASAFTVTTAKTDDGDINITVDFSMGSSIFLGAMKASEYSAEAAAALANAELNGAATNYQKRLPLNYETWEYGAYETLFSELYENPTPDSYVLWMADPYEESITPDIIETYMLDWGKIVTVAATDITFQDATVTITPAANTEYFYGISRTSDFYPSSVVYQLSHLTATSETINSTLSTLGASVYLEPEAGTSYTVWTVVKSSNPAYQYSAADVQKYEFSLSGYTAGGSLALVFGDVVATSTKISVPITVPSGAVKMYIQYLPDSQYGTYSDDQIVEYLLSTNDTYVEMTEFSRNLDPETAGRVCAIIIDENGQYGTLAKIQANSTAVPRSSEIGVSSEGEPEVTLASAAVPLTFTGDPAKFVYYMSTKSEFDTHYTYKGSAEAVISAIALNPSRYGFTSVDVSSITDGKLSVLDLNFATEYVLIGVAVDADNMASETYVNISFTTPAPTVIPADGPTYETMFPDLSGVTTADNYIRGTIEPKEGTTVYYCVRGTGASLEGEGIELIKNMMAAYPTSGSTTLNLNRSFWIDSYMYVTCVDAEGNWYEPKIIRCTYVSAE